MSDTWEWADGGEHYGPPNPYSDAEACGLEIVASMDDVNSCYDFNYLIVWRHTETGKLYHAHSAGCSCPTPFEDYRKLADLTPCESVDQMAAVVRDLNSYDRWPLTSVQRFLEDVERALKTTAPAA